MPSLVPHHRRLSAPHTVMGRLAVLEAVFVVTVRDATSALVMISKRSSCSVVSSKVMVTAPTRRPCVDCEEQSPPS